MFLALNPNNNFGLYSLEGLIIAVIVFLIVYFLFILVPPLIIADAIKKSNKQNNKISVEEEEENYFKLANGINLPKNSHIKEWDIYEMPYGYYIPVYNWNKSIIAFIYESK